MLRLALVSALFLATPSAARVCDAVLHDAARGRDVPVRLTTPDPPAATPIPLIFWSPGLGGGLAQGARYAEAWARAGLATLQFQHPGSDAQVYIEAEAQMRAAATPEAARAARTARVRAGSSGVQIAARVGDVAFALSRLPTGFGTCATDRLDQSRLGIAGHSMGAWITQIFAGQRLPGSPALPRQPFKAALSVSGSALATPADLPTSASGITRPFMLVMGSLDGIAPTTPPDEAKVQLAARTALWPHLPAGEKYLYVPQGAQHLQLAGTPGRGTPEALAARLVPLTTAFWASTLQDKPFTPPPLPAGDVFERR